MVVGCKFRVERVLQKERVMVVFLSNRIVEM